MARAKSPSSSAIQSKLEISISVNGPRLQTEGQEALASWVLTPGGICDAATNSVKNLGQINAVILQPVGKALEGHLPWSSMEEDFAFWGK